MTRPRVPPGGRRRLVPAPAIAGSPPAIAVSAGNDAVSAGKPEPEGVGKLPELVRDPGWLRQLTTEFAEALLLTTSAQSDRRKTMDMENAGELVTLGTDIVRLGGEMKEARAELTAAQARVSKLEAEMQPKLMRHAQLIQQAAGVTFPAPHAPAPAAPLPDWAPPIANLIQAGALPAAPGPDLRLSRSSDPTKTVEGQLKQRVKDYLKRHNGGEEGISATDVADVLKVDALLVREAMRELRTGR